MSWQHLRFLPKILSNFWVVLSSDRNPVLVITVYRYCCQFFIHWRLKLLIKLSYMIFLSSVHSILKFKALITKKHKAIGFSNWVHQVPPITGIMLYMLSRRLILQSIIKIPSVIYTYELHFTITHSFFKRKSQICSKLHQLSWKKKLWVYVQDKLRDFLIKKRWRKSSHSQIFESNRLNEQNVGLWGSYDLKQGNPS